MILVNNLAIHWWQWMGAMFWQVGLLIVIIASIDRLIRKWAWPQVRYALWLLVLLKLVLPPSWSSPTSLISHAQPKVQSIIHQRTGLSTEILTRSVEPVSSHKTQLVNNPAQEAPVQSFSESVQTADPKARPTFVWQVYPLMAWILGIVLFASILIVKMRLLRRWHDQQDEKSIPPWFHELLVETACYFGLSTLPAIVFHNQAKTPAVYGLIKPVLLLPANYLDHLSRKEARHLLLHELAHLKRGDLWLHGLCLFLQIIYWFNPFLIWARRQMKHVREICCDLTVANVLREETPAYRLTLLNTAREMLTENMQPGLGLLGVFEEPFRLVTRLKWLEKNTWQRRRWMVASAVLISLLFTAAVIPMAAMDPLSSDSTIQNSAVSDKENSSSGLITSDTLSSDRQKEMQEFFQEIVDGGSSVIEKVTKKYSRSKNDYVVEDAPPLWLLMYPVKGAYDQAPIVFEKLDQFIQVKGIQTEGTPIIRQYSNEQIVPSYELRWDAAYAIPDSIPVPPPFEVKRLPKRHVLDFSIAAGFDQNRWSRLTAAWLYYNNYKPVMPHLLFWTHGLLEPGEPVPSFKVQIQVQKVDTPYCQVDLKSQWVDPARVLILPMTGSLDQERDALKRLLKYVQKRKIEVAGDPFVQYFDDPQLVGESKMRWQVGIQLKKGADIDIEAPFQVETGKGGSQVMSARFESETLKISENDWLAFVLTFTLNGYAAKGHPVKVVHQMDSKPYQLELCWAVDKR